MKLDMNEHFERCLYESGLTAQGCWDELDSYTKDAIEEFAKLIAMEAAQVAWRNDIGRMSKRGAEIGLAIELHFGVD